MKRLAFVLLVLFVMAGCASAGKRFSIANANRITNGMTREEVIRIMGTKPYQISDGGKTFVWSYAKVGAFGRSESRAVRFSFDENGRTYDVPESGVFGDTQKYMD